MALRFLVAAGCLGLLLGGAEAAPLDAATCGLLKGEQMQLEKNGVRESMSKGPEWAKATLGPDKLEQIKRLMSLDEQIIFRCSGGNLVELPPEVDADPAPASSGKEAPGDKAPAKAKPPAKIPAKTPAKPPPKKADAPWPKPKVKVNDAYRPPGAADPQANPFAGQLQKQ